MDVLMNFDWSVLNFIHNDMSCGFLDTVMPFFSVINNYGMIWLLLCAVFITMPKYRSKIMLVLIGLLAGVILGNGLLKNLIARDRPCWLEDVVLLVANPTDSSFPSGHALSSFIAAALLTFTNRKFAFFAYPLAVIISFSRLYLYLHFPSDVIFSAVFGTLLAVCIIIMYKSPVFRKVEARFNSRKNSTR